MLKNKTLPEFRRPLLRRMLQEKKFIRVIEAHNGISALIGERAKVEIEDRKKEFDAMWISSLTDSVAKGYPDEEIISIDSRLDTVNQILNVTTKPIMYDGDTGGFPEQLNYLVKQLERLGVSAIVLEDKKYPKSNSLLQGACHNMEDIKIFAEKIEYAKNSQASDEFMVIGRIESLIVGESLTTALKRARAYIAAGADAIMIHSKSSSPEQVFEFADEYRKIEDKKPLMCVPTTYCSVFEADLMEKGFNIVLYANHLLRASFRAMENICELILKHEKAEVTEEHCASLKEILRPVGSLRTFIAEYKTENKE